MSMSDDRTENANGRERRATDHQQGAIEGTSEHGTSGIRQVWQHLRDAARTVLDDK